MTSFSIFLATFFLLALQVDARSFDVHFDTKSLPKFSGETHQIVSKLLEKYDNLERPQKNEPTKVDFEFKLLEGYWRQDDLHLKLFVRRSWHDQRLKFEPKEGGRDHIHLPDDIFEHFFWHPRTFFVHAMDFQSTVPATVKIYTNGTPIIESFFKKNSQVDNFAGAFFFACSHSKINKVAQKDIYKIRLYRPLTSNDRGDHKINGTITISDFRYSNRGVSMNFPPGGGACLTHGENVNVENVQCAKFVKRIKDRDYDQLVIKFDLVKKS